MDNRPKGKGYECISDLVNNNSPKKAKAGGGKPNEAEPLDMETFYEIADKISVSDDKKIPGKVNINTANEIVLTALLAGGDAAEQLAENIVSYREGLVGGMESIAEVMKVNSMKLDTFKRIAKYITTRSDIYSIHCVASVARGAGAKATMRTDAVVDRGSDPYRTLYWYQGTCN